LRSFYNSIGGTIHSLDPAHRVESGFVGNGSCGSANGDFTLVGSSPGIDVLTYHDYYPASQTMGGDKWNGIAVRLSQANSLDKPILAGEDGIVAGGTCGLSGAQRAHDFRSRFKAQTSSGAIGMLLWNWEQLPTTCSYDIGPGDPSLKLLRGLA
jgi:mannan endo-1,4-beta-mannosidase